MKRIIKKRIYPFLKLDMDKKEGVAFGDWFQRGLYLPPRKFPPKLLIKDDSSICGGYFIAYNRNINRDEIFNICKNREWSFFEGVIGEFFLIFADFKTEEIFVIVDQNGRFPCYFSVVGRKLFLSPDFGLVKDEIKNKTLNLNYAFDFLDSSQFLLQTDATILTEIKQMPTGTVLCLDANFKFKLRSFIDIDKFFRQEVPNFKSVVEFSNAFLLKFQEIIMERVAVFENLGLNFASDLSTGFDSSLISYLLGKTSRKSFRCITMRSPYTLGDMDPKVAREFAKKHSLKIDFFNITGDFLALSDFDLEWVREHFYPGTHQKLIYSQAKGLVDQGISIWFNGYGGDEVYGAPHLETEVRFLPQMIYFKSVVSHFRDNQLRLIFTTKGLNYFLDHDRFRQKNYFPIIYSFSALYVHLLHFSLYWEAGVWPIEPFIDPRLVHVARGMPLLEKDKLLSKFDIWKHHPEIFIEGQFKQGGHMSDLFKRYLIERKDKILEILEGSSLEKTGLFRVKELLNDISKGNEGKYLLDYGVNTVLLNLLHLEYFIQQNNVKIPNY